MCPRHNQDNPLDNKPVIFGNTQLCGLCGGGEMVNNKKRTPLDLIALTYYTDLLLTEIKQEGKRVIIITMLTVMMMIR